MTIPRPDIDASALSLALELITKLGNASVAQIEHLARVCDRAAFRLHRLAVEHPDGLTAEALKKLAAPKSTRASASSAPASADPSEAPKDPGARRRMAAFRPPVKARAAKPAKETAGTAQPAPTMARPGGGQAKLSKTAEEILAHRPLRPPPTRPRPEDP